MTPVWVFDAYGTLFDPHALIALLESRLPGRGAEVSRTWRDTQLRYTWLRSLMDRWVPFEAVTRDALRYAARAVGEDPDALDLDEVLAAYATLPPFVEVVEVLQELPGRAAILSNGSRAMIHAALHAAALAGRFDAILTSDDVAVYKPSPRIYRLATERLAVPAPEVRFVSANAWDCAGAASFGFSVWRVARVPAPDEELGVPPPARTIADLRGLLAP